MARPNNARAIADELGPERAIFIEADVSDRAAMETLATRTVGPQPQVIPGCFPTRSPSKR